MATKNTFSAKAAMPVEDIAYVIGVLRGKVAFEAGKAFWAAMHIVAYLGTTFLGEATTSSFKPKIKKVAMTNKTVAAHLESMLPGSETAVSKGALAGILIPALLQLALKFLSGKV